MLQYSKHATSRIDRIFVLFAVMIGSTGMGAQAHPAEQSQRSNIIFIAGAVAPVDSPPSVVPYH